MLVGLVNLLRVPVSSDPVMLSAGRPVDLSVIASIERQVSRAYFSSVRVFVSGRGFAAAVGPTTVSPTPRASAVEAASAARVVRRRFIYFSRDGVDGWGAT